MPDPLTLFVGLMILASGTYTIFSQRQTARTQQKYSEDIAEYERQAAQQEAEQLKKEAELAEWTQHRKLRAERGRRLAALAAGGGGAIDIGTPVEWLAYQEAGDQLQLQAMRYQYSQRRQNILAQGKMNQWYWGTRAAGYAGAARSAMIGGGLGVAASLGTWAQYSGLMSGASK